MISQRRQLVIDSWRTASPNAESVGTIFYRRLFEIDPNLRRLLAGTAMELTTMLDLIVHWLGMPDRLVPALKQLGERHTKYGVMDEHYAKVGTALIGALEESLGDKFTPEVRSAWTEALILISSLMRRGAAKISGTFPAIQSDPERSGRATAGIDAA